MVSNKPYVQLIVFRSLPVLSVRQVFSVMFGKIWGRQKSTSEVKKRSDFHIYVAVFLDYV